MSNKSQRFVERAKVVIIHLMNDYVSIDAVLVCLLVLLGCCHCCCFISLLVELATIQHLQEVKPSRCVISLKIYWTYENAIQILIFNQCPTNIRAKERTIFCQNIAHEWYWKKGIASNTRKCLYLQCGIVQTLWMAFCMFGNR